MSKAIEKGSFVHNEGHPEYGVGRVLAVEAFATRVLFPRGGLRVFRAADTVRLKTVATPPPADLEILDSKEAALAKGIVEHLGRAKPEPKAKKSRAKKAK